MVKRGRMSKVTVDALNQKTNRPGRVGRATEVRPGDRGVTGAAEEQILKERNKREITRAGQVQQANPSSGSAGEKD